MYRIGVLVVRCLAVCTCLARPAQDAWAHLDGGSCIPINSGAWYMHSSTRALGYDTIGCVVAYDSRSRAICEDCVWGERRVSSSSQETLAVWPLKAIFLYI